MAAQSDDVGVLRFHERCGEAVIVGDNGMTVEKREKLQQADIEHGGLCKISGSSCAALTNRPLRVSEIFEVEITENLKHPTGSLSIGLISQSPETIDFPFVMTDLRAGTWILQGLTSGARVMVAGETITNEFLSPAEMDNLKCGDRLGLMITKERSLVIILNRKIVGTAAMGIPEGVYAFVEIHRKFQAVKLNLLTQEESAQIQAVREGEKIVHEVEKHVENKPAADELPAVYYKRLLQSSQEENIRLKMENQRLKEESQQRMFIAQQKDTLGMQQQTAIQHIEREKQQLQAQIRDVEKRLQAAVNGNRSLQQQIQSLQQQLHSAEQRLRQEQASSAPLRHQVQSLQAQLHSAEQLSAVQSASIQQAQQQQIRLLEQHLAENMEELRQERASIAPLHHRVQFLQHQLQANQSTSQRSTQHAEFWEVNRDEVSFDMSKVLGTGAWGYTVEGKFRGQTVAVKCLHAEIQEPEFVKTIRQEMNIMAQIRHPNLVLLIAATVDSDAGHLIVTELLDTTLLKAYQKGKLSTVTCKLGVLRDVASALNYLHLHRPEPIIHRDVSSANVLLEAKPNDTWKAKLADFGSAKLVREAATIGPGSPAYSAPEVSSQLGIPQTSKVDVYSYGILVCEVASGQFPSQKSFPGMVRRVESSWPPVHRLISSCIQPEPDNRLRVVDILAELDRLIRYTQM